eukprot:gene1087-2644_t
MSQGGTDAANLPLGELAKELFDLLSLGRDLTPLLDGVQQSDHGTRNISYSIFNAAFAAMQPRISGMAQSDFHKTLVAHLCEADPDCDRAVGSMVGPALGGDAFGAPLEFLPVEDSPPPFSASSTPNRPFMLTSELSPIGHVKYHRENNPFNLCRGQWTDDHSMALCIADSLLTHKQYVGSDLRA